MLINRLLSHSSRLISSQVTRQAIKLTPQLSRAFHGQKTAAAPADPIPHNSTPEGLDLSVPLPITRPDLGHHLMMTFTAADPTLLSHAHLLVDAITPILEKQGCTICNVKPQQFKPIGATVVWTLAESHFSIHTWPEHHTCVIDFFTCQTTAKEICETVGDELAVLFGALNKPESITERISIPRGVSMVQANGQASHGERHSMLLYAKETLFYEKSKYQKVEIMDTGEYYGKVLLLDNVIQIAETPDNYSEAMIRPHAEAKCLENLLVIGGGDCKIAKKLLSEHTDCKKVTVVDIDEVVTQATLEHFPSLRFTEEEEQYVNICHEDASAWVVKYAQEVADGTKPRFTGCIIDCTDPDPGNSISASLFTAQFYETLLKCLEPGATISQQVSHDASDLSNVEAAGFDGLRQVTCSQLEYTFPLTVVVGHVPYS